MRRPLLLLLVSTTLACPGGDEVPPLASSAASARPFVEGQLATHKVPVALARALPDGLDTPVFALTLHDSEVVGFQFEIAADRADFQARGLRRLAARLSAETPAAVWLSPAEDPSRRQIAVMTVSPLPWRVMWATRFPDTVDSDLLESLLDNQTGPVATLHEVGVDHVTLEFEQPAGALAEMVIADGLTPERRAALEHQLSQRQLTLPVP